MWEPHSFVPPTLYPLFFQHFKISIVVVVVINLLLLLLKHEFGVWNLVLVIPSANVYPKGLVVVLRIASQVQRAQCLESVEIFFVWRVLWSCGSTFNMENTWNASCTWITIILFTCHGCGALHILGCIFMISYLYACNIDCIYFKGVNFHI